MKSKTKTLIIGTIVLLMMPSLSAELYHPSDFGNEGPPDWGFWGEIVQTDTIMDGDNIYVFRTYESECTILDVYNAVTGEFISMKVIFPKSPTEIFNPYIYFYDYCPPHVILDIR